jgi:hypothetical protein
MLPELPRDAQVEPRIGVEGFEKFIVNQEEFATDPAKILLELGNKFLLENHQFPNVYYNLNGQPSEAIDAGGVRRDLISSLSENLFKGKGKGFLTMKEGIPLFQDGQDDLYRTLGKILAFCYLDRSDFKVGALFSEKTYELICSLPEHASSDEQSVKEWFIFEYAAFLGLPPQVKELINLDEEVPELEEQEKIVLNYFLDIDMEGKEYDFSLPEIRHALRDKLVEEAYQDKRLVAIMWMGKELKSDSNFVRDPTTVPKLLMDRVQGVLDGPSLLQKLSYEQSDNVTDRNFAKVRGYLTNWINRADEETLRRFVRTVTGNNSLSENPLKIEVYNRDSGFVPVAHTCFFSLELTANCPDQEQFDQKLEVLLTEGMAGSGFQFA